MAATFPYLYLIRPRDALFAALSSHAAWQGRLPGFAEPQTWSIDCAGNHDWDDELLAAQEQLKLLFLASMHETRTQEMSPQSPGYKHLKDSCERERALALSLLGTGELTVEVFNRFWSIEPAGVYLNEAEQAEQTLSLACLRAVRGPTEPSDDFFDSPAVRWQAIIARRPVQAARFGAAVRWALAWLARELPERQCSLVSHVALIEQEALESCARAEGFEPAAKAPLTLIVKGTGRWNALELEFVLHQPDEKGRLKPVRKGELSLEVSNDEEPRVESAVLTTKQVQILHERNADRGGTR